MTLCPINNPDKVQSQATNTTTRIKPPVPPFPGVVLYFKVMVTP